MSDKGPGKPELILKRLENETKRLDHSIVSQELQLMEMEDQRERIAANILATKQELKKQQAMVITTKKQYEEGEK